MTIMKDSAQYVHNYQTIFHRFLKLMQVNTFLFIVCVEIEKALQERWDFLFQSMQFYVRRMSAIIPLNNGLTTPSEFVKRAENWLVCSCADRIVGQHAPLVVEFVKWQQAFAQNIAAVDDQFFSQEAALCFKSRNKHMFDFYRAYLASIDQECAQAFSTLKGSIYTAESREIFVQLK